MSVKKKKLTSDFIFYFFFRPPTRQKKKPRQDSSTIEYTECCHSITGSDGPIHTTKIYILHYYFSDGTDVCMGDPGWEVIRCNEQYPYIHAIVNQFNVFCVWP